jgi:hypothetical protein
MKRAYPAWVQQRIDTTETTIERAQDAIRRSERLLTDAEQMLRRSSERLKYRPL